jgi:hypothetical protein
MAHTQKVRHMNRDEVKEQYIELLKDSGYIIRELSEEQTCAVDPSVISEYDAGLFDSKTMIWDPSVDDVDNQSIIIVGP